jgi:oligopeptide/dipeptide ABC transporter ATP-binding protein
MSVLRIAGLELSSARGSLHGVSLAVEPGEVVGLVGDPRSGAETLVAMLLGELEPDELVGAGEVELITEDAPLALQRRTARGMRALRDLIGPLDDQRMPAAMAIGRDPGHAARPGERAFVFGLARRAAEAGRGVVIATPDLHAAVHGCTRIAVLYAGRIVELAGAAAIAEAPEHPATAELLATIIAIGGPRDAGVASSPRPVPERAARGCAYHRRCAYARELCRGSTPALVELADGHASACVLAPWQPGRLTALLPARKGA